MEFTRNFWVFVTAIVFGCAASSALALDDFQWKPALTGAQQWQVDGNWVQPDFPNAGTATATISVASDLTLDVGATNVAVVALTLDGTNAGTDIDVVSTGGKLVFQNDADNVGVDPAPGNPDVEDILMPESDVNHGRVYVTSNGAAGSTNTISAPISLANNGFLEGVDFFGTNSITLSGAIDIAGATADDSGSLRSYLPSGAQLRVTGPINLTDSVDNTTARFLVLNNYYTTDHADPPRGTIQLDGAIGGTGGLVIGWTWDVDGVEDGTDDTLYDPAPVPSLPFGTVIVNGDNTFTGDVVQARGNLVLGHDNALGSDNTFSQGGPAGNSKEVGYDVISTSDDRKIANNVDVSQWITVKGASTVPGLESIGDHSIEFSGQSLTTNSRGWVNLLPAGKILKLSGPQYAVEEDNGNDPFRFQTYDGTGRTVITGGIHNREPGESGLPGGLGYFRKRGTGTVVIDFDESNTADTPTDYVGETFVESGNLHFATESDLPDPQTVGVNSFHLAEIQSTGGAIGLDSGVLASTAFKSMLNNSSHPNVMGQITLVPPFFADLPNSFAVYPTYDSGGVMLAAGEYGSVGSPQSLNFEVGGNLEQAANMTLAAWETGSTFRGTITPSSTVPVNPNTYQLGGGSGTLTLPDNNQLTGARSLLVTNGGEVRLDGTQSYTGKTRVTGKFHTSLQEHAVVGTSDTDGDGNYVEEATRIFAGSTLTVASLANAGVDSGIGNFASSSDATGLLIQGSTLKYVGGATSTNRLFTVGTVGATVDASGTGTVNFDNSGALGIDVAENRTGIVSSGGVPGLDNNEVFGVPLCATAICGGQPLLFDTSDLVPGMFVRDVVTSTPQLQSDLVITDVSTPQVIQVGEQAVDPGETPWGGTGSTSVRTFEFGPAPARFLTLSGSNTGNNTLAPLVADAADRDKVFAPRGSIVEESSGPLGGPGGNGSVGIQKTGPGKWILTGNNTYTGATNVEAGTLLVNGNQTGSGLTTVSAGATLGGDGSLPGALINNGTVAPGASAGTLTVSGSYVQSGGASLAIEIGGTGASTFDKLQVLAGVEGDYNDDRAVNAADYTVWRNHLGATFQLMNEGDDVSPGMVDAEDYDFWKENFGNTNRSLGTATLTGTINIDLINGFAPANGSMFTILTAVIGSTSGLTLTGESSGFSLITNPTSLVLHYTGAGAGGLAGGTVPEPATGLLVGLALLGLGFVRRRGN